MAARPLPLHCLGKLSPTSSFAAIIPSLRPIFMTNTNQKTHQVRYQRGFSVPELIVILAIVSVVSAFAIMGITKARAAIRLQNSVRQFASYVERARADALRR